MGQRSESTFTATDALEFAAFPQADALVLQTSGAPDRYPRALKVIDVTSGTTLEVVTAEGNTRTLTVSAGEEVPLQISSITGNTTCDRVRVYW